MGNINPRADLIKLIDENCDDQEKRQFYEELSRVALDAVRTNNYDPLRQLYLDWEYTVLWKKNSDALRILNEQTKSAINNDEDAVDWRSFLSEI